MGFFRPMSMLKRFAAGMSGSSSTPLTYLLRDIFTTPDAAPITSPRTCEPGPGVLTLVQTDGTQALSSGKHVFTAQATPVWGDQGFHGSAQTRAAGLALADTLNLTTWEECGVGWHAAAAVVDPDSMEHAIQANTTDGQLDNENATPIAVGLGLSTNYRLLQILRSVGCFYVLDGNLIWVENADSTATLYPAFANLDGAGSNGSLDVVDLPDDGYEEWDEDFSTVTDSETNPASGTTFDHDADFHIRLTHTYETGKSFACHFRKTDGSNYLNFQAASNALTVTELPGGTLDAAAGVFADGVEYQIDLVAEGSSIKVYLDNFLKLDITETSHQTVSGGQIFHNLVSNDIVFSTHPTPALGVATSRFIAPQASGTATHENDFLCYIRNWTNRSNPGALYLYWRYADASNCIRATITDTGYTTIHEVVAGGYTAKIEQAGAISDDDDWALICVGNKMSLIVEGAQVGSTATLASITTGTSFVAGPNIAGLNSIDSIEFYPYDVAALLPSEFL